MKKILILLMLIPAICFGQSGTRISPDTVVTKVIKAKGSNYVIFKSYIKLSNNEILDTILDNVLTNWDTISKIPTKNYLQKYVKNHSSLIDTIIQISTKQNLKDSCKAISARLNQKGSGSNSPDTTKTDIIGHYGTQHDKFVLNASINTKVNNSDSSLFERKTNKSNNTSLGTSIQYYPTQNAVKSYADTKKASNDSTGASGYERNGDVTTKLALKANLISPSFTTPILGTPQSGALTNCTFPTLNQSTTGTAHILPSDTANRYKASTRKLGDSLYVKQSQQVNGISLGSGNITITAAPPDSLKKVVNQTFTKVINLTYKEIYYNNYTITDTITIYPAANALKGSSAFGVLVGDGTHTPTLLGIVSWPFSDVFDKTASAQNYFQVKKFSNNIIYISWKRIN